jgi:hypothetical protein
VNLDLAATPGSGAGDGQADTVIVNGTAGDDSIAVAGNAGHADVLGLAARVHIAGAEAANDRLIVDAGAGDDAAQACTSSCVAAFRAARASDLAWHGPPP